MQAQEYHDVLVSPGEADITAHVDFEALSSAAKMLAAKFTDRFLKNCFWSDWVSVPGQNDWLPAQPRIKYKIFIKLSCVWSVMRKWEACLKLWLLLIRQTFRISRCLVLNKCGSLTFMFQSEALNSAGGVRHGFFTREGGTSRDVLPH